MLERIVEIAENNRHLSINRGLLSIKNQNEPNQQVGQVPLDDIGALIVHAYGITYTHEVIAELSQRGIPFVCCNEKHLPTGYLLPCDANFEQSKRIQAQIERTQPLSKQLWAAITKSKIEQQALTLQLAGKNSLPLLKLSEQVRSGDPNNMEAQAAKAYWRLLFGNLFRRDRQAGGINALLNYGYTIYRAATARAIVAAGLSPSIGIHHSNAGNPMRLVDDMIEPYRAQIDLAVWEISKSQTMLEVSKDNKRILIGALYKDMDTKDGKTPVYVHMQKLATSLAQVYLGEAKKLTLPIMVKS